MQLTVPTIDLMLVPKPKLNDFRRKPKSHNPLCKYLQARSTTSSNARYIAQATFYTINPVRSSAWKKYVQLREKHYHEDDDDDDDEKTDEEYESFLSL